MPGPNGTVTITKPEDLSAEQIAGMNPTQLQAEIKLRYDRSAEIEKKYGGDLITDQADEDEVKRLLGTLDRLEDALAPYEERRARKERILANVQRYNQAAGRGHRHPNEDGDEYKTPGQQFTEAAAFQDLDSRGLFKSDSNKLEFTVPLKGGILTEHKALVWSGTGSGGALIAPDRIPGLKVPTFFRELTLLDLIPSTPTTSDSVVYVRETSFVNAAAPVPEATGSTGTSGLKSESTLTYQSVTDSIRTIAHWIPVTNKMLSDVPAIRGIIDARLLMGLNLVLEAQIITGNGTGENLNGILNQAINTQARGTDSAADAIFKGMLQVMVTGLSMPSATVLNPIDFGNIRLARESGTSGGYLMGPPSMAGPTTLWGRPLTMSLGIPQGTALTGDFATGCMLYDREEGQVRVGWINDFFVRNMQVLLAELRAGFALYRLPAFTKITGL